MEGKKVIYRLDIIFSKNIIDKENLQENITEEFPNVEIVFHDKEFYQNDLDNLIIEVKREEEQIIYFINNQKITLDEIKQQFVLAPRIFLINVDFYNYATKLGKITSKKYQERVKAFNLYNKIFNRNFGVYNGIDDIYDSSTGAIIIFDYEIIQNFNNMLMKLFLEKKDKSFIYSLPVDNGHLLRGANTYYYFIGYVDKNVKIKKEDINSWYKNYLEFFQKVINVLKNYNINNAVDIKLLLGLVDNIRNFILLLLNAEITSLSSDLRSLIYSVDANDKTLINDYVCCAIDYQKIIFDLCFNRPISNESINHIILLIEKIIDMSKFTINKVNNLEDDFLVRKCFNINREIDHYFENYISCSEALKKCNIQENTNIIGLLYGGLELPLIIKFNEYRRDKSRISFVLQNNGDYIKRQKIDKTMVLEHLLQYGIVDKKLKTILIDDNIMSGVTMQLLYNQLYFDGFHNIADIISIRYPSLNRIPQLEANGYALNLDLIDDYIKGMLNYTPYTKISRDNYEKDFTNRLNFYSVPSKTFLEAMYLNGSYISDSEVDIFKK